MQIYVMIRKVTHITPKSFSINFVSLCYESFIFWIECIAFVLISQCMLEFA